MVFSLKNCLVYQISSAGRSRLSVTKFKMAGLLVMSDITACISSIETAIIFMYKAVHFSLYKLCKGDALLLNT